MKTHKKEFVSELCKIKNHFTQVKKIFLFLIFCSSVLYAIDTTSVKIGKTMNHVSKKARVVLSGETGTFQIYALGKNGREFPIFFNYNNASSSYFSLMVGKKMYRLNRMNGVSSKAELLPDGCRLIYTIEKRAKVMLDFFADNDGIVKVIATVKNISKSSNTFSLKAIFDTVFGEQTDRHFSTANLPAIKMEKQFMSMKDEQWIVSRNNEASVQFILYGYDVSPLETVTLGNKDVVSLPLWTPVISTANSFDSVVSYNNSAIALNWESHVIPSNGEVAHIFYLALETENDASFNAIVDTRNNATTENNISSAKRPFRPNMENKEADVSNSNIPSVVQSPSQDSRNAGRQESLQEANQKSDGAINKNVTGGIDMDYVRRLINRINSLDESDVNFDPVELQRLNNELDAILERVK
ncbi:MAG: hypothetical protein IJR49_04140 [Treponema sp.]|nr:hypothetical protein [Treponema sp.]